LWGSPYVPSNRLARVRRGPLRRPWAQNPSRGATKVRQRPSGGRNRPDCSAARNQCRGGKNLINPSRPGWFPESSNAIGTYSRTKMGNPWPGPCRRSYFLGAPSPHSLHRSTRLGLTGCFSRTLGRFQPWGPFPGPQGRGWAAWADSSGLRFLEGAGAIKRGGTQAVLSPSGLLRQCEAGLP